MTLAALLPPLLFGLAVATVAAIVAALRWRRLGLAAAALGLRRVGLGRWEGTLQGVPLLLAAPVFGEVRLALACPQPAALRRRDPVLDLADPPLLIGDAVFAQRVHVSGDSSTALRWLTPHRRAQVSGVLAQADLQAGPRGLMARCAASEVLQTAAALRGLSTALSCDELPSVRERWAEESCAAVRVRLLTAHLDAPEHREWLLARAADDPSDEVRGALAHVLGDRQSLLEQVLSGNDEVAELAFRRLRDDDRAALAGSLLEHLITAGASPRLVRQLGALHSPLVVPWLHRALPQLDEPLLDALAPTLIGLAAAAPTTGPAVADLAVEVLRRSRSPEVWRRGLELVRRHGHPGHLGKLPDPPDPAQQQAITRARRSLEDAHLAEQLSAHHGLVADGEVLRGQVGGHGVSLLMEPDGATLLIDGIPPELVLAQREAADDDFCARFAHQPSLVFGPAERAELLQLSESGSVQLGPPRAGHLRARCPRASASWLLHGVAVAQALREAGRTDPAERVDTLLHSEHDSLWLARWIHAAEGLGLPPLEHPSWSTHLDPAVRVAYACWHGDGATLLTHLDDPEVSSDSCERAVRALIGLGPTWLRPSLERHPDRTLAALLEAPDAALVATAVRWWQESDPTEPTVSRALLELSLAAPHPSAEPLWCRALGTASPPPRLGTVMVRHGGPASWTALDVARRAATDPARAESLGRAADALRRRLGSDGAVSLVEARGELSLAEAPPAAGAVSVAADREPES